MSDHEMYEIPHDEEPKEGPDAESPIFQERDPALLVNVSTLDVNTVFDEWVFTTEAGETCKPRGINPPPDVYLSGGPDHSYKVRDSARDYDYDDKRSVIKCERRALFLKGPDQWFTFHNVEIDPSSEITAGTLRFNQQECIVEIHRNEFWVDSTLAVWHGNVLHPPADEIIVTMDEDDAHAGIDISASVSSGIIRSLIVLQPCKDNRSRMGVPLIAQDGRSIGCQVWDVIVWSLYQGDDLPSLEYDVFGTDSQTDHWILGVRPGNIYEIERSGSHIYSSRETATQEGLIHFTAPPGPCKIRLREATTA